MAEGALISVVASIVRVLGTPSFKELGNFWGHKKKFEKLENTMSLLEAVIQDAEAKQINSRQIEHWLERLEDAVYEVDSLLDEFQTEALRSQAMPGNETTKKRWRQQEAVNSELSFSGLRPRHPLCHLLLPRPRPICSVVWKSCNAITNESKLAVNVLLQAAANGFHGCFQYKSSTNLEESLKAIFGLWRSFR